MHYLPSNHRQQYPVRSKLSKTNMLCHEFEDSIHQIDAFQHFASQHMNSPSARGKNREKNENKKFRN